MEKNKNLLLSIDFDGTIVEHEYPLIGKPLPYAFEVMKELQDNGVKLMLNTCREGKQLREAVEFCRDNGIVFRSVNENHIEDDFRDRVGGLRRKIFAQYYIDDRNLGGFPGWLAVRKEILGY
jgi:hypothetical protein